MVFVLLRGQVAGSSFGLGFCLLDFSCLEGLLVVLLKLVLVNSLSFHLKHLGTSVSGFLDLNLTAHDGSLANVVALIFFAELEVEWDLVVRFFGHRGDVASELHSFLQAYRDRV